MVWNPRSLHPVVLGSSWLSVGHFHHMWTEAERWIQYVIFIVSKSFIVYQIGESLDKPVHGKPIIYLGAVLSKYFRVLSEFSILSDWTKFFRTKLFIKPFVKPCWYYFQSLKGKKYFILSLKCYECLQKQRDDIKSNCCPIRSLIFRFFSSIKWIFFYNFCRTFGPALKHFLSDIHKKCPIVRQVRRISTPLLVHEKLLVQQCNLAT